MKSTTKKNYLEKKNKTSPLLKTPEKDFHPISFFGKTTSHHPFLPNMSTKVKELDIVV